MRRYIGIAARGLAMGAADIVPGVSGGTIAFITGIYEELLESLSSLNFGTLKSLFIVGLAATWKKVNGNFLVALFAGILISIFSLAKAIKYFLEFHPHLLWSFFFGLLGASIIYVGKKIENWNLANIIGLIVGSGIAFYLTLLSPGSNIGDSWYIFVCGAIAICAMILPGISGSFILLLLGAYPTIITAVSDREFTTLGIFAAGCIIGLLVFSKVLNWMFKNHKDLTIAVLTGFLIGSMNKLWPWKENVELLYTHSDGREDWLQSNVVPRAFQSDPQILFAVLLAGFGFALIFLMERFASKS